MIVGVRSQAQLVTRLAVGAGLLLVTGLAAVPAVGQSAAAPTATAPTAACPTTPGPTVVAGYTLSTLATGVHGALNSPGLLPVGDAEIGTLISVDAPLSRIGISAGPVVSALSSPLYPGDTVAHLGTALQTFGVPIPVPNDPVVAEANFPPTPSHGASASFSTAGLPAQVLSGQSTASASSSTALARVASTDLGGAFTTGTSDTATASDLQPSCVDVSARSTTAGIVIAGVVQIAGITGYAAARSDGATGVPQAELQIGKVKVAGLDAYIDRTGVHLSQQGVGAGVIGAVEATLQKALQASGTTIHLVDPSTTHQGGSATADSGAIVVSTKQLLPGIGHPPQGTPPIPLVVEVSYGHVQAAVNATSVPAAPSDETTPTVGGSVDQPSTNSGASQGGGSLPVDTGTSLPVSHAIAPPAPTGGSQVLTANSVTPPGRGEPVPIGWILVGLVASIIAIGPLLGYARWQLLEGRI